MPSAETTTIFKTASTTYFTSSLFFPPTVKEKVFTLYAFVRVADDFVDAQPQDAAGFYNFCAAYRHCLKTGKVGQHLSLTPKVLNVIENFVQLQQSIQLKQAWVDAFLKAMELDLYKSTYHTLAELKLYMYGSAEVIGLMVCACADIDPRGYSTARMLGRAMQYANFLRDIAEDISLGRQYIPTEVLESYGITELSRTAADSEPARFANFFAGERRRYEQWNVAAKQGFIFLPRRIRIPVATATTMYSWTIQKIAQKPRIVFARKVKPTKWRVLWTAVVEWCSVTLR
jgi:phytoene synthase